MGLGLAWLLTLGGSWVYWNYSQEKIATLNQDVASYKMAKESAEASLAALREDIREQTKRLDQLGESLAENRRESEKLRDIFAEHDLEKLAKAKPGLIENRVNKGTKDVLRNLEELTDPKSYDGFVRKDTEEETEE